jgi:hypothetical protein
MFKEVEEIMQVDGELLKLLRNSFPKLSFGRLDSNQFFINGEYSIKNKKGHRVKSKRKTTTFLHTRYLSKSDILQAVRVADKGMLVANQAFLGDRPDALTPFVMNSQSSESAKFLKKMIAARIAPGKKFAILNSAAVSVDIIGIDRTIKMAKAKNRSELTIVASNLDYGNMMNSIQNTDDYRALSLIYLIPGVTPKTNIWRANNSAVGYAKKIFSSLGLEEISTFVSCNVSETVTLSDHIAHIDNDKISLKPRQELSHSKILYDALSIANSPHRNSVLNLNFKEFHKISKITKGINLGDDIPLEAILKRAKALVAKSDDPIKIRISKNTATDLLAWFTTKEEFSNLTKEPANLELLRKFNSISWDLYSSEAASMLLAEIAVTKGIQAFIEVLEVGEEIWIPTPAENYRGPSKDADPIAVIKLINEAYKTDDGVPFSWTASFSPWYLPASSKAVAPTEEEKKAVFDDVMDSLNNLKKTPALDPYEERGINVLSTEGAYQTLILNSRNLNKDGLDDFNNQGSHNNCFHCGSLEPQTKLIKNKNRKKVCVKCRN